jgi:tetratricopeptide (TPR) repeat protein
MARLSVSLILAFFLSLTNLTADTPPKSLSKSEVLALVAGNALPENIIHVLGERGLNFHPDESYRSQLKAAGADAKTLAALDSGTVLAPESSAGTSDQDRLQHISNAAAWMKDKRYTDAAQELQAYHNASFGGAETGFVMGELLRREQRPWEAVAVYEEVLRENADFPEAHAKLSYVLYQAGDYEESLREADAALAQNPQNPEGHKNAGLALESMRKFDAGEAEYRNALRLKPDYELVLYDLGNPSARKALSTTLLPNTRRPLRSIRPIWAHTTIWGLP